jgi:dUTPase
MIKAKWTRLEPTARVPEWSDDGSYFLFKPMMPFRLDEGSTAILPTGLALELPDEYQLLIRPVPKLIGYGINVYNNTIEKFDDHFYRTEKHQIYLAISIDRFNHHEFWPDDEVARGVIIHTPKVEFSDESGFEVLDEEQAKEVIDTLTGKKDEEQQSEPCGIEATNSSGAG